MNTHELRVAVRDFIRDNPSRHDQRTYVGNRFGKLMAAPLGKLRELAHTPVPETPEDPENPLCGTTGCVAGWAVIFAEDPADVLLVTQDWLGRDQITDVVDVSGNKVNFDARGMELLGLDDDEAEYLFDFTRSRKQVLKALDALVDGNMDNFYDVNE